MASRTGVVLPVGRQLPGADPAQHAEPRELADALRRAVTEALSDRQRRVFVATVVDGIPLDALAAELG